MVFSQPLPFPGRALYLYLKAAGFPNLERMNNGADRLTPSAASPLIRKELPKMIQTIRRTLISVVTCVPLFGCASDGGEPLYEGEKAARTACSDPRPKICTFHYDPVCGLLRDRSRRTYGNACSACADPDVLAHAPGECVQSSQKSR